MRKLSCAKKFFVLGLATGRAKSVFGLGEAKNSKINIILFKRTFLILREKPDNTNNISILKKHKQSVLRLKIVIIVSPYLFLK